MNYQVNSALQYSHVTQQKDVAKTDWRLVHFLYNSIIQTFHFQTKRTPECVLHYVNNKYYIKTFKIILSMQKHFNNEGLFYKYSWFYNINLMKICAGLKQIVSQCFCTAHLNSTQ